MKNLLILMVGVCCLFLFSSCTSYKYLSRDMIEKDSSVIELARMFADETKDSLGNEVLVSGLEYLFTHLKLEYGEVKWQEFSRIATHDKDKSFERILMDVYDESLYTIGAGLHYGTRYPYKYATNYDVAQSGFINLQFWDSTSIRDRDILVGVAENYCNIIDSLFLNNEGERELFFQKLGRMNDGYVDVALIANEYMIEKNGLKYATGQASAYFYPGSRTFNYRIAISSKYINPLSTITLLHELVHVVFRVKDMPIEYVRIDRNESSLKDSVGSRPDVTNVMLDEGVAEYVSRNFNVWRRGDVFEPVDNEMLFLMKKNDFPWLSLNDMQEFYYGKRKASFTYVEYGLTAAHSLVDYMVGRFGFEKVLQMVNEVDAEKGSLSVLGVEWASVMAGWKQHVLGVDAGVKIM